MQTTPSKGFDILIWFTVIWQPSLFASRDVTALSTSWIGRPTSCLHRLEARGKYIIVLQHFLKVVFDQDRQFQDNTNSSTFYGPSLDEVWSFCLHWSCSPIDCSSRCRGGATPMQAKWIKLDLALYDVTYIQEMVASKKFYTPLYSPVRLLLIYHFYK